MSGPERTGISGIDTGLGALLHKRAGIYPVPVVPVGLSRRPRSVPHT